MLVEIPAWYVEYIWLFIVIGAFEFVLKAFALWHSARSRQLAWFVVLIIFNTAGILPIIYLLFFRKKAASAKAIPAKKKR